MAGTVDSPEFDGFADKGSRKQLAADSPCPTQPRIEISLLFYISRLPHQDSLCNTKVTFAIEPRSEAALDCPDGDPIFLKQELKPHGIVRGWHLDGGEGVRSPDRQPLLHLCLAAGVGLAITDLEPDQTFLCGSRGTWVMKDSPRELYLNRTCRVGRLNITAFYQLIINEVSDHIEGISSPSVTSKPTIRLAEVKVLHQVIGIIIVIFGMSKKRAQSKPKEKKASKQQPGPTQQAQAQQQPKTSDEKYLLYQLLQLEEGPKSTIEQIKKQYRKLVMLYHPDKNLGDEDAKQKFHKLQQAYQILSDPEQKKVYDETGLLENEADQKSFETAYQYFRQLYKKIEKEDIEAFEARYRSGDMEKEDLLDYYTHHEGDMTKLLESIPLSRNEDIPRFIAFFEQKIADKTLNRFKAFDKSKDKVRLLVDQSQQFEKQHKQGESSLNQLALAIRNKSNKTFLDSLEQKYCKPVKKKVEQPKTAKQKGKK